MNEALPRRNPATYTRQVIVCKSPTSAMQRITDATSAGFLWLVNGTVPAAKWQGVEAKFSARYPELDRDRFFVHRQRKAGQPVHRLVVFRPESDERVTFYLLATAPDELETWLDATNKRTRPALWSYAAARLTKPGEPKPVWSWRIQAPEYIKLRDALIDRVRSHRDADLLAWIESTKKWPGFAAIRKQHKALGLLLAAEWRRSRAAGEPVPEWPRLRYVQRVKTR